MDTNNKKSGNSVYGIAVIIVLGIAAVFLASKLISVNASWLESFSKNGEIDPLYRYVVLGIAGLAVLFIGLVNVKNLPIAKSANPYGGLFSLLLVIAAVAIASGNFTDLFIFLFIIPVGIYYNLRAEKAKTQ